MAWTLRRLRKEASLDPTQAKDFCTTLHEAVKFLHKDESTAIAKDDFSFKPLLTAPLANTANAGSPAGFLEAFTLWITIHVVLDVLFDLASWAEQSNQVLQEAGLEKLLQTCEKIVKKIDPESPEKPRKRRRITEAGNRKTWTCGLIKDAMDLP